MRYPSAVLALALMACGTVRSPAPSSPREGGSPRVVAYLASWGVRSKGTRIADLPGDRLTDVIYAFAVIGPA